MTEAQKIQIKEENIARIRDKGYRFIEWLPVLEASAMRSLSDIKGRMSVMNALINISFEAPVKIIKDWISQSGLDAHLSEWEKAVLEKTEEELSNIEFNTLRWYLEGLWALMWATQMIESLDEKEWCGDEMATLLPNLEEGETNQKIEALSVLRTETELYTMLDYYYRLHWYCVDERIKENEALVNEGLVYERRKALEWLMNKDVDWDHVEMGT